MLEEITLNINWLAVIVGAIVAFILGAIWYNPKVFGTKWAEGVRLSLEDAQGSCAPAMITQAIGTFLLAWVVGVTASHNALITMILILVTIIFLVIAGGLFAKKSSYAITTEASYIVAMVFIMILAHAIF